LNGDSCEAYRLLEWATKTQKELFEKYDNIITPKMNLEYLSSISRESVYRYSEIQTKIMGRMKQLKTIICLSEKFDFYISLADYETWTLIDIGFFRLIRHGDVGSHIRSRTVTASYFKNNITFL
jgi:hypothetical protein